MICLLNIAKQFLKHNKDPHVLLRYLPLGYFVLHTSIKNGSGQETKPGWGSKAPGAIQSVLVICLLFFVTASLTLQDLSIINFQGFSNVWWGGGAQCCDTQIETESAVE